MDSFPAGNADYAAVRLDDYNSDLNFVIEADGVTGSSLHNNGFEYIWAGARATHGVSRGKVCYEVLVQEKLEVKMAETEKNPHVMRVGWSVDATSFAVGEVPLSYGYGGTGRASLNNNFFVYGEPYSTDDVITAYIDLDAVPKTIFFAKNGNYLDVAFRLGPEANGKVFYPHVSVKNMRFVANFGGWNPYFPPIQGFHFIQCLPPQILCLPPISPKSRHECEVLMMVGLPSCGKTTWLKEYVKDHREKKYNVLGTNDILVKMKVMGLTRKRNYGGRWDALIKQASGILNEMLKLAKNKSRNYILDQTNVYPSARRRKMNNFQGYRRVAVVVVNENSVLKQRNDIVVHRDGKVVPESAFMEMKSNFALPVQGEVFDEVWYVEENEERSQHLVQEFNDEGRRWKREQTTKRPIDDVQMKREPGSTDFKKHKFRDSTSSSQSGNQHGVPNQDPGYTVGSSDVRDRFQHNSDSHHFYQGGERSNVPYQEGRSGDARRQQNYTQPNQNAYPIPQDQQYNLYNHERGQQVQGNNYGQAEGSYNQFQGSERGQSHSESHGRFHQRQPGERSPSYHQARKPGNNYNRPGNPLGGWDEGGRHQGQHRQNERNVPRHNNNQRVNTHHSQNENYPRRDDNSSTNFAYSSSSQGYPVKQESWHSAQGPCQNPNQGYYDGNQSCNPSQSYHGNLLNWSSTQQGGGSQGYWDGGPERSLSQGLQGFQTVPQVTRQDNWSQNQSYYP